MKFISSLRRAAPVSACVAAVLAACSHTPRHENGADSADGGLTSAPSGVDVTVAAAGHGGRVSQAPTPRAYRADAATHLYAINQERIFKGKLPPMLYAVGVLQVEVDGRGGVRSLHWMRAPQHAPEVVAEIERTVRAAAPFPIPARMGKVTYTDTWLWDKSGQFQLDTLTEGQL